MSADFLAPDAIKKVFVELKDLTQNPPEGIKVLINEEDVTDIQALIDGPGNKFTNIIPRITNCLIRGYSIFWWCFQNEIETRFRISSSPSQRLFLDQDLPSKCV